MPVLLYLGQLAWRPDVIWVVEPPQICAPAAALLSGLTGATSWLHNAACLRRLGLESSWINLRPSSVDGRQVSHLVPPALYRIAQALCTVAQQRIDHTLARIHQSRGGQEKTQIPPFGRQAQRRAQSRTARVPGCHRQSDCDCRCGSLQPALT